MPGQGLLFVGAGALEFHIWYDSISKYWTQPTGAIVKHLAVMLYRS